MSNVAKLNICNAFWRVMANKIMLQRVIDYEHDKDIVKQTLNLVEKE